jgi:putative membrane protein
MKPFFTRWTVTTLAVLVAAQLPGIHANSLLSLLCASLLLGVVNALVRPVLLLLSLPLILVTLGFFILIINALMLRLVAGLVPGFFVDSFGSAFLGAIVISIVSWFFSAYFRGSDGRFRVITREGGMKQVSGRVIE